MTEWRAADLIRKIKGETAERYVDRHKAFDLAVMALKEIEPYREIGTVKECREAREKQRAKKPLSTTRCKDGNHPLSQDIGGCPSCKSIISENMLWCDDCGQKLDWSDTE